MFNVIATLTLLLPPLFFFIRLAFESPHMLVPPWVEGMLRMLMPCKAGPSARFNEIPSHWEKIRQKMFFNKWQRLGPML
jgi:hypothetical protein